MKIKSLCEQYFPEFVWRYKAFPHSFKCWAGKDDKSLCSSEEELLTRIRKFYDFLEGKY